jgi:hypothetical protein
MSIQGALETLVGAFVAFYIACVSVGRPDIPLRLVTELRVTALAGTTVSWGCPSVFHRDACHSYDPRRYR